MKFKLNVNGITEEIADKGILILLPHQTLQESQSNGMKANLLTVHEENGSGDEKKDVSEKVTETKTSHQRSSEKLGYSSI